MCHANWVLEVLDQLYTSTEQTDADFRMFDELCVELEKLHIEERFAQRVWDAFNLGRTAVSTSAETEPSSSPADTSGSSESSGNLRSTLNTGGSGYLGRKRQRGIDEDEDGESREDDQQPQGKRLPGDKEPLADIKFACPYRKYDTQKYCIFTHRLCVVSHWPTIPRLKEHLYRCHQKPIYCGRCKTTFRNEGEKCEHEMALYGCSPSLKTPDGLTETQLKSLKRRAKNPLHKTEVDRWNGIYAILFPGVDIPSPYFEPAPEATQQPSRYRDLARFRTHVRRGMNRCARTHLARLSSQRDQPYSDPEMENLIATFESCLEDLFQSYPRHKDSRSETQTFTSASERTAVGQLSPISDAQRCADIIENSQSPKSQDPLPDASQLPSVSTVVPQPEPYGYSFLGSLPDVLPQPLLSDSGYGSIEFDPFLNIDTCYEDNVSWEGLEG
ncbi:hypothetical protein BJ875DRAFT_151763 [Amylocarpus encephaloides]|uniref:C2H2-type domain-containing protein n=1 Tax=Amylocarpus encephaloides TaxID=45428 RepID=A0A9P8C1P3_9HELO|nr:hypothetical protein BJ875DRAFT_151763 [Amylocarpus encephaloides]